MGAQSLDDKSQMGWGLSASMARWNAYGSLFYWSKSKELVISVDKKSWKLSMGLNSPKSKKINTLRIGLEYSY